MEETFKLANPVQMTNPNANIDSDYGTYASVELACVGVLRVVREIGKTVGIIVGGVIVEYQWKKGIDDEDLEVKDPIFQYGKMKWIGKGETDGVENSNMQVPEKNDWFSGQPFSDEVWPYAKWKGNDLLDINDFVPIVRYGIDENANLYFTNTRVVNTIQSTSFVEVYSANKTLSPTENQKTIFMDSGTLTINPNTQAYQNGYAVAVKSSGVANTPLVLSAATDWTYQINGATALASGSLFIEKGYTCTIIGKANLKIFSIDGSII